MPKEPYTITKRALLTRAMEAQVCRKSPVSLPYLYRPSKSPIRSPKEPNTISKRALLTHADYSNVITSVPSAAAWATREDRLRKEAGLFWR